MTRLRRWVGLALLTAFCGSCVETVYCSHPNLTARQQMRRICEARDRAYYHHWIVGDSGTLVCGRGRDKENIPISVPDHTDECGM